MLWAKLYWSMIVPHTLTRLLSGQCKLAATSEITAGGLLRVDTTAIAAEAKLDGKFLLRSSDPQLSAEDIARGYKQLAAVERGWRDMKQILDLRPIYHRREDRIRAHVLLCWLALLLVRLAETHDQTRTWRQNRGEGGEHLLGLATVVGRGQVPEAPA